MIKISPERIENKRFEKTIRLFKILAISSVAIVGLYILSTLIFFNGEFEFVNFSGFLFAIGFYFEYKRKARTLGGQFIEWTENEISFKTRQKEAIVINYESITDIIIKLHEIIIKTDDNEEHKLYIEDFTDYTERMRIKNNFESITNKA